MKTERRILEVREEIAAEWKTFGIPQTFGTVIEAGRLPEAIGKIREDHFDLIILGIMLPTAPVHMEGYDHLLAGLEVLNELERLNKPTPVVVITANADSRITERLQSYPGPWSYLPKPIFYKELQDAVCKVLNLDQPPATTLP